MLYDPSIIEEQERVEKIVKQWRKIKTRLRMSKFFIVGFVLFGGSLPYYNSPLIILMIVSTYCIYRYSFWRFWRQISAQDIDLLKKGTRTLPDRQYRSVVDVIWTYEASVVSPKMLLLRPSTQPEDDILLRAAAYTDNTPQEELLRPANTTGSNPPATKCNRLPNGTALALCV